MVRGSISPQGESTSPVESPARGTRAGAFRVMGPVCAAVQRHAGVERPDANYRGTGSHLPTPIQVLVATGGAGQGATRGHAAGRRGSLAAAGRDGFEFRVGQFGIPNQPG